MTLVAYVTRESVERSTDAGVSVGITLPVDPILRVPVPRERVSQSIQFFSFRLSRIFSTFYSTDEYVDVPFLRSHMSYIKGKNYSSSSEFASRTRGSSHWSRVERPTEERGVPVRME